MNYGPEEWNNSSPPEWNGRFFPRYGNASLSSLIIFPLPLRYDVSNSLRCVGFFRVVFFSEVFVKWRGLPGCFVGQVAVEMFKIYELMWERNIWKKWTWGLRKIQQYSRNSGLSVNQISKHIQSEMRDFLSCSGEMSFWLKAAVKWKTWIFEGSKTTASLWFISKDRTLKIRLILYTEKTEKGNQNLPWKSK